MDLAIFNKNINYCLSCLSIVSVQIRYALIFCPSQSLNEVTYDYPAFHINPFDTYAIETQRVLKDLRLMKIHHQKTSSIAINPERSLYPIVPRRLNTLLGDMTVRRK